MYFFILLEGHSGSLQEYKQTELEEKEKQIYVHISESMKEEQKG